MYTNRAISWTRWKALFVLLLAVVLPYGLLFLRFSLRNDQVEYFLAVRMYMTDAFSRHEYMLWNPFMSGSFPVHCDMQASVWNPIAIGLSWLVRYNASWLSVEFLLYYMIGVLGCFYFARNFSRNYYSCIVIGVIYGCGGIATSIMEFMSWIGSFAFLPWVIHFFYLLLKRKDVYATLGFAIALWLMLVCGYPSFLIYLGYVLLAVGSAYLYRLYTSNRRGEILAVVRSGVGGLVLFLLLSAPAIHSFYEYLPYYARGSHAPAEFLNQGEYLAWNYPMSLLFPVAGYLVWDNNFYIGLLPFLLLCVGVRGRGGFSLRSFRDRFLLAGALFTLVFTFGRSTPLRIWCAGHLPLMDAFEFSHSMNVFLIFVLFFWLVPRLDIFFSGEAGEVREAGEVNGAAEAGGGVRRVRYAAGVAAVILVVCLIAGYQRVDFRTDLVRKFYYICGCWELGLLLLLCFSKWVYASVPRRFFFVLADLVVSVFMLAPLTGLTLTPSRVYDRSAAKFYRENANDYLLSPELRLAKMVHNLRTDVNAIKLAGRSNFPSNTRSEALINYVHDSARHAWLLARPFLFADDGTRLDVRAIDVGYNFIDMDVNAAKACWGVMQQTYYPRWRAERPEYAPSAYKGVFLQTRLRAGENRVRLYYYGRDLFWEGMLSVVTLLAMGIVLFRIYRKNRVENF